MVNYEFMSFINNNKKGFFSYLKSQIMPKKIQATFHFIQMLQFVFFNREYTHKHTLTQLTHNNIVNCEFH